LRLSTAGEAAALQFSISRLQEPPFVRVEEQSELPGQRVSNQNEIPEKGYSIDF
jgi:hypothetical protein